MQNRVLLVYAYASIVLMGLLCPKGPAHAQFVLSRSVVGTSNGAIGGSGFSLTATLGQPTADEAAGGSFRLDSGFWGFVAETDRPIAAASVVAVSIDNSHHPLDPVTVSISAGDFAGGQPANDLLGIGFKLHYDPSRMAFLDGSFVPGPFINPNGGSNVIQFTRVDDPTTGILSLSISRTDGIGVTGEGIVGTITFTIVDFAPPGSVNLTLSDMLAINVDGVEIPMRLTHATSQVLGVWPGDTNSDCVVDIFDLLPIGTAFGSTIPARPGDFDISWAAKPFSPSGGHSYIDGTGDGIIDQNDLLPLGLNFGMHRFDLPGSECTASATKTKPASKHTAAYLDLPAMEIGETITVNINTAIEHPDMVGGAFEMTVPSGFTVQQSEPGILLDNGDVLRFHQFDAETGRLSMAFSRKGSAAPTTINGSLAHITLEAVADVPVSERLVLARAVLSHMDHLNEITDVSLRLATAEATSNQDGLTLPLTFRVHGAYPNPFNPTTTISFDLPEPAQVTLLVFDLLGRNVGQVDGGILAAGTQHRLPFDATHLASGTYLFHLVAETTNGLETQTGQVVLMK